MKDISQKEIENELKLVTAATGDFEVKDKNFALDKNDFIVIAGAHKVESLEQMEEIAKALKSNGLKFIRGGAFKPHAFPPLAPNSETAAGLKILKEITDKYNLISVSEVMAMSQIELASQYIDVFQVGARNMQNYNLLTEIGKSQKPVVLKRHPGTGLRDFLGAAEWLMYYGCKNLILCERGTTAPFTHDVNARWILDFQIVPAVRRICKLPIIMDVTHSSGVREFVPSLMTAAAGLGADGLMVEIKPELPGVEKILPPGILRTERDQVIDLETFSRQIDKVKKINDILNRVTI